MELAKQFKLHTAHIEFTSACNLRCVYCPVSQPNYKARTLPANLSVTVANDIKKLNCKEVNLNGHGETTIIKGWHESCKSLLNSSIRCNLISNLSKQYSEAEINALCRLHTLTISCDSLDPFLYHRLRRNGSLTNILITISRIRNQATDLHINPPSIGFSCVLGADNATSVDIFINLSRDLGINFIQFCHLTEYPEPPDAGYKLSPLSQLQKHDKHKTLQTLLDARETGEPDISIQHGIIKVLSEDS